MQPFAGMDGDVKLVGARIIPAAPPLTDLNAPHLTDLNDNANVQQKITPDMENDNEVSHRRLPFFLNQEVVRLGFQKSLG